MVHALQKRDRARRRHDSLSRTVYGRRGRELRAAYLRTLALDGQAALSHP